MQKVLRSGVTSISVPGGTWFTDVGVRDAIKLGLMQGPRMYVAGRMIVTYGCIEDDEPSWEGATPARARTSAHACQLRLRAAPVWR